jgi:hypothetical protein
MTDRADDTHLERRQQAVAIGVLQEQVSTLGREMAELKKVNADQSAKLDQVLTQLARADGGYRAFMWLGGFIVALNGLVIAWLTFWRHPS